jgi:ribokinase
MSASVTVFGSANTDYVVMVPRIPLPSETVSGGAPRPLPGGNRVNQATATARQGQPTAFVGSVGDDAGGATLRELLGTENVDTRLLQLEVPIPAVLAAARQWKGSVVLNPAPAEPEPEPLWHHVDLRVLNQTERESFGSGANADVFAAQSELTVPQSVTTLGGDGCAVMAADGTCTPIRPPAVSPIDTSRAGDTLCGVIAAGLSAGMAPVPAAVRASVAAGLSTEHLGAQSGPKRAVIDARDLECEIVPRPPIERTPVHLR